MRILTSIGLVVLGIVIGAVGVTFVAPVEAQASGRFRMVDGNNVASSGLVLVTDDKSGGCWLLAQGVQGGVALATAPLSTCN